MFFEAMIHNPTEEQRQMALREIAYWRKEHADYYGKPHGYSRINHKPIEGWVYGDSAGYNSIPGWDYPEVTPTLDECARLGWGDWAAEAKNGFYLPSAELYSVVEVQPGEVGLGGEVEKYHSYWTTIHLVILRAEVDAGGWMTSRGNYSGLRVEADRIVVCLSGRRHGVRSGFLLDLLEGRWPNEEVEVVRYNSWRTDVAPWEADLAPSKEEDEVLA